MQRQDGSPPVVFHFRTEYFETPETPDEVQEWEQLMIQQVGLSPESVRQA